MKKILFFSFYNKLDIEVHPGVAVLSAALKANGYQTKLQPYFYYDEERFTGMIRHFDPDFICISATHMAVEQVRKLAKFLKSATEAPVLLGGVFPILDRNLAASIEGVDAVCVGEGVEGLLQYISGIHPAVNIMYPGSSSVVDKGWSSRPTGELDYRLFWDELPEHRRSLNKLDYWTSFTCEYGCAFCCNKEIRELTGLRTKPRQDMECSIRTIKELTKTCGAKKVHFRDPLVIGKRDLQWAKVFLPMYSEEIGLPYTVNIRADVMEEELVQLLKETGCRLVKMGLESGSEWLRNKVLRKGETDQQFLDASALLRKYGIKLSLNAMLGIPHETMETARMTLEMMEQLNPDKRFLHIFQPWPGVRMDSSLVPFIRYERFPALNDSIVAGRTFRDDISEYGLDPVKAAAEYVLTPVLDQVSFPYLLALEWQQAFHESGESE
ncbi:B12-binding domain-containing radical SAM protein [Paenibacillus wynnii]|uniref:Uncharacterized protein n=1 Tax=Paenibacillus wynnii TaxID=268407 RepID=A0A098MB29_9BACL|nr:B12-binding domain-containing radical SAM protein [Paenibacillus wynnii]KGE19750.1 hypothetical protein PWYN_10665 [Paenibacillus wynnii]